MATHIFSGSSHPILAALMARALSAPLSKSQTTIFKNSEQKVKILDTIAGHTCIIVQSTGAPTDSNILELFFFCDAFRRSEAGKIIAVIPYFGYSRQDRQHEIGECVSMTVIGRFLENIGFNKIITINIHSEASAGIFTVPFENIDATEMIAKQMLVYLPKKDITNTVILAPDHAAVSQAREFAEFIDKKNPPKVVVIDKIRNKTNYDTKVLGVYGDMHNKTVIIVDDIVTTGSTLFDAAYTAKKHGAKEVYAAVVHHDFVKGTIEELERSKINILFTTNTIPLLKKNKKIIELSVVSLLKKELQRYFKE